MYSCSLSGTQSTLFESRDIQTQLWPMVHCLFFLFKMRDYWRIWQRKEKKNWFSPQTQAQILTTVHEVHSFYLHFYPMLNLKLIHEGSKVLQNLIFLSEFQFIDYFFRSHFTAWETERRCSKIQALNWIDIVWELVEWLLCWRWYPT